MREPPPLPSPTPPDIGSRLSRWLALAASVVLGLGVVGWQMVSAETEAVRAGRAASASLAPPSSISPLVLGAKVAIGFDRSPAVGADREKFRRDLLGAVSVYAKEPADRIRYAILKGELGGGEEALEALGAVVLLADHPLRESLTSDLEALRKVYSGETVTAAERESLEAHHGWFARLALTYGLSDNDPDKAPLIEGARRLAVGYVAFLVVLVVLGLGALVCFVTAIVLLATGRVKRTFRPPLPGGSVYLETFALFLAGFVLLQGVQAFVPLGGAFSMSLNWLLLAVPFWPVVRGMRWRDHRMALGWHFGRGLFREVGAGVAGYLAGLPVVAVGLGISLVLIVVQGLVYEASGETPAPPSHPVIDMLQGAPTAVIVLLLMLGTVWAPVVEEAIFRGALYRHARGRAGAAVSGLMSAVVFAALHPQGLALIPALASLGFVFALLREWRGSLIAPMTAHALHNGMVLSLVVLIARA